MGSGTVLAVARAKGHHAYGVDIDPLAVLIAKVWTTAIDPDEVQDRAAQVMDRARARFAVLKARDAYPRHANDETKQFASYWFDDYARRQLTALSMAISGVRGESVRNVLWCAFSRLIIAKQAGASLAMDLPHSRPHKTFARAPTKPFRKFMDAVERVTKNCISVKTYYRGPATTIYEGDARDLYLSSASFDIVVTSPPYLNAIDYMRCSKFSLIWMGYGVDELRQLRSSSVGAERRDYEIENDNDIKCVLRDLRLTPAMDKRNTHVLSKYIHDMRQSLSEVARVLKPSGRAVYVVGENTIRGTYVRNSIIVSAVAELAGLKLGERTTRRLPARRRYLPPPIRLRKDAASLDTRMGHEVVLTFKKAA